MDMTNPSTHQLSVKMTLKLAKEICDAHTPCLSDNKKKNRSNSRSRKPAQSSIVSSDAGQEQKAHTQRKISFVIPLLNESETLDTLYNGIASHVPEEFTYEVIFIDDGSTDESWEVIQALSSAYHGIVRGLKFRSNRGKASALTAGFRAATGDIIITMDADLQDDPVEIPRFIEKLDEGYGLVSGWKQIRHDPWHKVLPSRIFNRMLSHFGQTHLHDHNCGFKCYHADFARSLTLYGELHRMVPSLATIDGYQVAEIVVTHRAREFGVSKYGIERFLRGFSDMLTIGFQTRFRHRPSHLINVIAGKMLLAGLVLMAVGVCKSLATVYGLTSALGGMMLVATSFATLIAGQLSEMIIRGGLIHEWTLPIVEDTGEGQEVFQPVDREYRESRENTVVT